MIRAIAANVLLAISKGLASADNREPKLTFSEHGFDYRFTKPDTNESHTWDDSQYSWGAVFIKGFANSVKIPTTQSGIKDGEPKLMPSSKYKQHMRNHVFEQALFAHKLNLDQLKYIMIGTAAISGITLLLVATTLS